MIVAPTPSSLTAPTPYDVRELQDAQWLVSQLEAFCLEHGHPQDQVNAWILARLIDQENTESVTNE